MSTPQTNAPEWAAAQGTPWITENKAKRIFDAFSIHTAILDRDLSAPPVSCVDGARYLVAAGGSGLWLGESGKLAIAFGANASNGWVFANVANEGVQIWVVDEQIEIEYLSGAWHTAPRKFRLQDLNDVDVTGLADGDTIKWDASNGVFYFAPEGLSGTQKEFIFACSDESTAITTGTSKVTFRLPYALNVTEVRASAVTAPTGADALIDINAGGVTILSTKLRIDAGEKSTKTSSIPAVISTSSLADDTEITVDFDQVGSTIAGTGIKVTIIGTKY